MLNVLRSLVLEAIVVDADFGDLGSIDRIEVTEDGVFVVLEGFDDDGDDGDGEEVPDPHELPDEPIIPDVPATPPENVHLIRRKA